MRKLAGPGMRGFTRVLRDGDDARQVLDGDVRR